MAHDNFSNDDMELLARALYLAGAFVAEAEDIEGDGDDEDEHKALHKAIKILSKDEEGDTLMRKIALLSLENKGKWKIWASKSFNAPRDAKAAMSLLIEKGADKTTRKTYRAALLFVARVVGEASDEHTALEASKPKLGFFARLFAPKSKPSYGAANISAGESAAIAQLSEALVQGE